MSLFITDIIMLNYHNHFLLPYTYNNPDEAGGGADFELGTP